MDEAERDELCEVTDPVSLRNMLAKEQAVGTWKAAEILAWPPIPWCSGPSALKASAPPGSITMAIGWPTVLEPS